MYWNEGSGNVDDNVSVAVGISPTASCAGVVTTIPNLGTNWTTTFGTTGANTTSPFTVSTSASQASVSIPAGGSLCLKVTMSHNTGGAPSMRYDGVAGVADTRLVPPSIVVPESLLGFAGLALLLPAFTSRKRWLAILKARK